MGQPVSISLAALHPVNFWPFCVFFADFVSTSVAYHCALYQVPLVLSLGFWSIIITSVV